MGADGKRRELYLVYHDVMWSRRRGEDGKGQHFARYAT